MADTYFLQHTDTALPAIQIAPGIVDGPGSTQHSTDLSLPGQGKVNYGTHLNQNLLHLMEHFAHPEISPDTPDPSILSQPVIGQMWFNTTIDAMYAYTGSGWTRVTVNTAGFVSQSSGDIRYIRKAGDVATGLIEFQGNVSFTNNAKLILGGVSMGVVGTPNAVNTPASTLYFSDSNKLYVTGYQYNTVSTNETNVLAVIFDDSTFTATSRNFIYKISSKTVGDPSGLDLLKVTYDSTASGSYKTTILANAITNTAGGLIVGTSASFGGLVVNNVGAPAAGTDAVNKTYVDDAIAGVVAGTSGSLDIPTADGRYVKLTGSTMSGSLAMGANIISNVASPVATTDAATKGYVDTSIASVGASFFPTGVILPFAGSSAPAGFVMCFGTALSRTSQANLFSVIGTTYGAGDGSTTYNVPDFRGRTPIGSGAGVGLTTRSLGGQLGEENHTLILSEIPQHQHVVPRDGRTPSGIDGTGAGSESGGTPDNVGNSTGGYPWRTLVNDVYSGGNGAHNTMQPSLVVNFIIKT